MLVRPPLLLRLVRADASVMGRKQKAVKSTHAFDCLLPHVNFSYLPSTRPTRAFVFVVAEARVESGAEFQKSPHEPYQIREAVEVRDDLFVDFHARLCEAHDASLRATTDGAREVE